MLISKSRTYWTSLFTCIFFVAEPIKIYPQVSEIKPVEMKIPLHLQLSSMKTEQNDFSIFIDDGLNLATSPFNFTGTDWMTTGAMVIATGLAFTLDPKIQESVGQQHTSSMDNLTGFGEKYGTISYAGIFAGGMYLTGKILGD
jgi:hypothetical protein